MCDRPELIPQSTGKLMVDVLHIVIAPTLAVEGIPLISALLGAIVVVFLFSLLTGRRYGRRGFRR